MKAKINLSGNHVLELELEPNELKSLLYDGRARIQQEERVTITPEYKQKPKVFTPRKNNKQRSWSRWSIAEDKLLYKNWNLGYSISRIASDLKRKKNAVYIRLLMLRKQKGERVGRQGPRNDS